ncbi:hypothetical protein DNI29_06650 [Hymenobacter sediminis]|uniref:ferritin-like domain-containing protein n=1 Tax=Hymenobacter sediminis TaxID=2218621 RepID=UPI000DA6B0E5|nr:ferritin-like domain-containing protein [Hymenobacter sediminis]RPD48302.1 hypothetical protein DNI29_06650 [Hymenobacter sediminis]
MSTELPLRPRLLTTAPHPSRRSFLRYTGASAALASLWLASCKKEDDPLAPATITGFSPASGMPGATITLTGSGFTGTTSLLLGTVAATFTVVNDTTITFTVPASAQTAALTLTTPGGVITSASAFTVLPAPASAPTITNVSPASALPNAVVTVVGTNFTGATAVTVNGTSATFTVTSSTMLTFVVPTASVAGAATLVIATSGGTATSTGLTVLPTTVSVGTGKLGVLNYVYALEQLEADFYTQVRAGSYYTGLATGSAEKLILDDLFYHEVIHREFFKADIKVSRNTPIPDLRTTFSTVNFNDRASVLNTAKVLEDLGVAAYNGVSQYLAEPAYVFLMAKIVSVEARHAAMIRDLVAESTFVGNDIATVTSASTSSVATNNAPARSSLERALSPQEVVAIANTFLADGSKLDVSGIR